MIAAEHLQTEHLTTPIGVDFQRPRLSWLPVGAKRQNAYRVAAKIKGQKIFDSGEVSSSQPFCVLDVDIPSRARVEWSVSLWDETGTPGQPCSSWFEQGLALEDWKAQWIDPEPPHDPAVRQPASYLKKVFTLDKAGDARLYITAHGIYDVWLNGQHIDGYLLAPGSSQYNRRLQVQTYDVASLLCAGENELLVSVGDGWYRGCTHNEMHINSFGTDVALLCQLEVDRQPVLVSDGSWLASQCGPLGLNDMMMGEEYDAQRETISDWHPACVRDFGYENLVGTNTVPVTAHETFSPALIRTPAGEIVLDFGQNIAGHVSFHLTATAGQTLILTHGETLDENGNFTIQNFQNPRKPNCRQQVVYICKAGRNEYRPTKCYFGFRYVKVEGDLAEQITGEEFIATAIYSDMEQTGWFSCGNEAVNQLFQNTLWSMKSNFVDVPTDCPTREKSGYSGDLVTFCSTAMYLMDCWPVLTRWTAEQAATQFEDGCVRQVSPNGRDRGLWDGGAGWCDSMELVPWALLRRYGDPSAASRQYTAIRRWMMFCLKRAEDTREENLDLPEELRPYFADQGMHWGEWLEPDISAVDALTKIGAHGEPEVATAFLSYGCTAMAEMAHALGKEEDAVLFAQAAEKARAAYRYRFIPTGRILPSSRQCRYVRPLAMGLLDRNEKPAAAAELADNVRGRGNHLNTGFLSTYELCRVLTDNGQAKTAYDLLLQRDYPSWLYSVGKGATTIWENWKGIDENGTVRDSMNHYSLGAVVGWLFDRVCGIVVENGMITIRPYPNPRLGWAKAVYRSPLGEIRSEWHYKENRLWVAVSIPCGAEANIILPDGSRHSPGPGEHTYSTHMETN